MNVLVTALQRNLKEAGLSTKDPLSLSHASNLLPFLASVSINKEAQHIQKS